MTDTPDPNADNPDGWNVMGFEPRNPTMPDTLLRLAVRDLHRWDVSKGWGEFNTILGRIDDHLDPALAHIDALTAAVPHAMTLARAMDHVDAEDDALGVVGRGRKVDRIIAAYRAILREPHDA